MLWLFGKFEKSGTNAKNCQITVNQQKQHTPCWPLSLSQLDQLDTTDIFPYLVVSIFSPPEIDIRNILSSMKNSDQKKVFEAWKVLIKIRSYILLCSPHLTDKEKKVVFYEKPIPGIKCFICTLWNRDL